MLTQNNHSGQDIATMTHQPYKSMSRLTHALKLLNLQADKCSKTLVPLYAGQPVATYNTPQKIWVPATVIHVPPWDSYQAYTSNGVHILAACG